MHWVSNIDQHPYNMTLDGQGSEAEVSKVMNEISNGVEVDEETAGELDAAAMTLLASAGLTPREMVENELELVTIRAMGVSAADAVEAMREVGGKDAGPSKDELLAAGYPQELAEEFGP